MAGREVVFDREGYPVRGRHRLTLTEFYQQFVDAIQTAQRREIWQKLEAMVRQAFASGIVARILVGGSFASRKPDPNDVDFVLILRRDLQTLRPDEKVRAERERFRRRFNVWLLDMHAAREGSEMERRWIKFLGYTRPPRQKRGVIEVIPDDDGNDGGSRR